MDRRERKNIRLSEYDYGSNGAYFVTICADNKRHIFGHVVGAGHPAGPHTELSSVGMIVDKHIRSIQQAYPDVFVDTYIIMPNHVHLLIRIDRADGPAGCPAPTSDLPKIISALKSICTREAKRSIWQRGYYEHVCRNYDDYVSCMEYVINNPAAWADDEYYT